MLTYSLYVCVFIKTMVTFFSNGYRKMELWLLYHPTAAVVKSEFSAEYGKDLKSFGPLQYQIYAFEYLGATSYARVTGLITFVFPLIV